MVQVKKAAIEDAILASAYALFRQNGYSRTSVGEIARLTGVSVSNIYVYFRSKLDILFAVYDPWLRARLERMAAEAAQIEEPERRLRFVLTTLWKDIPAEDGGFANNIMQALSTATAEEGYDRSLLTWAEGLVGEIVADCLPVEVSARLGGKAPARICFMAFDGFAMNHKLAGPNETVDGVIEMMVALLLGRAQG